MNLNGKNAIITGGGKGLGKAVALILAKEGVNVAITGRNEENLKKTVSEIKALGVQGHYEVFNVGNESEVNQGVKNIVDALGSLDIVINNAGLLSFGTVVDMPSAEWEQMFRTNLFGVYYMARAVYPYLKEKGGDVINVASTAGLKGGANMSAYAASKAAVISLSQSMMAEWRKNNIRVMTLTPSTIASDMSIQGRLTDGNSEKVVQPEDFAEWVRDILKLNKRVLFANGSIFSTNP